MGVRYSRTLIVVMYVTLSPPSVLACSRITMPFLDLLYITLFCISYVILSYLYLTPSYLTLLYFFAYQIVPYSTRCDCLDAASQREVILPTILPHERLLHVLTTVAALFIRYSMFPLGRRKIMNSEFEFSSSSNRGGMLSS